MYQRLSKHWDIVMSKQTFYLVGGDNNQGEYIRCIVCLRFLRPEGSSNKAKKEQRTCWMVVGVATQFSVG